MRTPMSRVEVVAIVTAGFLLLAVMAPVLAQTAERDNRQRCAANVRGIAQSMHVYGADNDDEYPTIPSKSATTYDAALKPAVGAKIRDLTYAMIYQQGKISNNPLACLWLLVLRGDVAPKQFVCPSDPFAAKPVDAPANADRAVAGAPALNLKITAPTGEYYMNFPDSKDVSYSLAYPWVESTDSNGKTMISHGGYWRAMADASIPIISDMAPYLGSKAGAGQPATRPATAAPAAAVDPTWATTKAASQNHQFAGQNVAFGDAHAEFQASPKVGQNGDSIFGIRKDGAKQDGDEIPLEAGTLPHPLTGKFGTYDTVMVPTRDAKGELK